MFSNGIGDLLPCHPIQIPQPQNLPHLAIIDGLYEQKRLLVQMDAVPDSIVQHHVQVGQFASIFRHIIPDPALARQIVHDMRHGRCALLHAFFSFPQFLDLPPHVYQLFQAIRIHALFTFPHPLRSLSFPL